MEQIEIIRNVLKQSETIQTLLKSNHLALRPSSVDPEKTWKNMLKRAKNEKNSYNLLKPSQTNKKQVTPVKTC